MVAAAMIKDDVIKDDVINSAMIKGAQTSMEIDHLIKMINQIADNIAIGENDDVAAPKVADHVKRFWARPMKEKIIQYAESDGESLQPAARVAISLLK